MRPWRTAPAEARLASIRLRLRRAHSSRAQKSGELLAAEHHRQGLRHCTGATLAMTSPWPTVTSTKNFSLLGVAVIAEDVAPSLVSALGSVADGRRRPYRAIANSAHVVRHSLGYSRAGVDESPLYDPDYMVDAGTPAATLVETLPC